MWNRCGLTQLETKHWPKSSKSTPQGLVVPSAKFSKIAASGMNAVDAAVAVDALVGRRAGLADVGGAGAAVAAVEPAVRAPGEAVGEVVPAFLVAEAVEDHLAARRRACRRLRGIGNEIELRRRHHPHAAEADLDAGDVVEAFVEELARVAPCRRRPCLRG